MKARHSSKQRDNFGRSFLLALVIHIVFFLVLPVLAFKHAPVPKKPRTLKVRILKKKPPKRKLPPKAAPVKIERKAPKKAAAPKAAPKKKSLPPAPAKKKASRPAKIVPPPPPKAEIVVPKPKRFVVPESDIDLDIAVSTRAPRLKDPTLNTQNSRDKMRQLSTRKESVVRPTKKDLAKSIVRKKLGDVKLRDLKIQDIETVKVKPKVYDQIDSLLKNAPIAIPKPQRRKRRKRERGSFDFDAAAGASNYADRMQVSMKGRQRTYTPPEPSGIVVEKEVTIVVRFYVAASGQVINVSPVEKGDARLENITMNYVKNFRFEALPPGDETEMWGTFRMVFESRK